MQRDATTSSRGTGRTRALVIAAATLLIGLIGSTLQEQPRPVRPPSPPVAPADDLASSAAPVPTGLRIGDRAPDLTFATLDGSTFRISSLRDRRAVVLAFHGVDCPISKQYASRLQTLHEHFRKRGVAFVGINSCVQDSPAVVREFAARHGLTFPVVKDEDGVIADLLGARRTTEVYILDGDRRLRFHGAIDDQYDLVGGKASGAAKHHAERPFLGDALEALLAGEPIEIAETRTPG